MRVLHIGKYFPPDVGGMETFLHDLVEYISSSIRCDVLCYNSRDISSVERRGKYSVVRASKRRDIMSAQVSFSIIPLMKRMAGKYDIIHLHMPNPTANIAYFLVRPKAKLVIQWQSDIIRQKRLARLYAPFQAWILNKADRIIASSGHYLDGSPVLARYREKCDVIPLGIDSDRFKSDPKRAEKIKRRYAGKRPMVLSVGRIVYYKGLKYLIEAMRNIDAVLVIGGQGEMREELEQFALDSGLSDKVFFVGRISREDLSSYYEACDIFCLPSVERSESFGMVQLEAMSFAKPVVSTDIPGSGTGWVNKNDITGYVVKPRDVRGLTEAIKTLIRDPQHARSLGYNGRKRVEEVFDIKRIGDKVLGLYGELLDR